jgi:flagellum-specific peptidoglycan hydrolase FlgJ
VSGVELDISTPESFMSTAVPTIEQVVSGTGIFPEVVAAQAALESGWGKSVKGGNYFGIKGKGQSITTHEVIDGKRVKIKDEFKTFDSFEDSVKGYKDFILNNPRYSDALQAGSPEEQAQALQDAGYATDPDYAKKLISIMKRLK